MGSEARVAPRVWLLTGDKAGDAAQLRVLARALGLPWVEKPLSFNGLYRLPNRLLGASLWSLSGPSRALLAPQWPDLVLCAGRRATPVARWIRGHSGGNTKLVNIGRPWGPLGAFDLVVATPQYGVPERANVLLARLPFNRVEPDVMDRAATAWRSRLDGVKPPRLVVLVGGRTRPLRFDSAFVGDLARQIDSLSRGLNASVLVITSRRTPADATDALAGGISVPSLVHRWKPGDTSNAYAAFIGLADRIVVTGDSASMLAEACHSGKPVTVAPVPLDNGWRERLPRAVVSNVPRKLVDRLHANGWIVLPRDISAVWRPLVRDGYLHVLGEPITPTKPPPDDLAATVERIRRLLN
jgi:mitochondrial fission protein ELM1